MSEVVESGSNGGCCDGASLLFRHCSSCSTSGSSSSGCENTEKAHTEFFSSNQGKSAQSVFLLLSFYKSKWKKSKKKKKKKTTTQMGRGCCYLCLSQSTLEALSASLRYSFIRVERRPNGICRGLHYPGALASQKNVAGGGARHETWAALSVFRKLKAEQALIGRRR